jgi:ketosteroid isomerase-like protein
METKTYRVKISDGSEVELANVVKARADGSGRHFEMADGDVISFNDGQTLWAIPTSATITQPVAVETAPAVEEQPDPEQGE